MHSQKQHPGTREIKSADGSVNEFSLFKAPKHLQITIAALKYLSIYQGAVFDEDAEQDAFLELAFITMQELVCSQKQCILKAVSDRTGNDLSVMLIQLKEDLKEATALIQEKLAAVEKSFKLHHLEFDRKKMADFKAYLSTLPAVMEQAVLSAHAHDNFRRGTFDADEAKPIESNLAYRTRFSASS